MKIDDLIIIPKATMDQLLKIEKPNDCISLYNFYYYTAKWQKTNQPKCTIRYASQGLKICIDRIRKAKKELCKLKLIEDVKDIDTATKKVKGWYIKLNYIFKKTTLLKSHLMEITEGGNENHPIEKPPSPKGHPVEIQEGNTLSTNSINALSTNNKYIGNPKKDSSKQSSNLLSIEKEYPKIKEAIKRILLQLISIGEFKHKLPVNGDKPSKLIKQCIDYLKWIRTGQFAREIKLDPKWEKDIKIDKWPDIKGYENWSSVKNIVLDSMENMMAQKHEYKKTGSELWTPPNLNQFFYNDRTKKSMFLKYMNVEVKKTEDITAEWQKNNLPKKAQEYLQKTLDENDNEFYENDILNFWSNMNEMYTWWKKNNDRLIEYNKAYDHGWGYHCSNPEGFFFVVSKYLSNEVGKFYSRPFPSVGNIENAYWHRFQGFILNTANIQIHMDKDLENKAPAMISQQAQNDYDRKVENEMLVIERQFEEYGEPLPPVEELRARAEKRLAEK